MTSEAPHILILGAGINGCALARELLLNDVSVTIVDRADICYGATAYSSRLIHGGLRYLEYGEFDLVRESLAERTRLLRLAPQFVRPLQLFIPVDNRWGGLLSAGSKFLGWPKFASTSPSKRRGAWLVDLGLWFYDKYARDPSLPKHRRHAPGEPNTVCVDQQKFRWLLSYYDAQVLYPERFTLSLLLDARQIALKRGLQLNVFTYHQAELHGRRTIIHPVDRGDLHVSPAAAVEFKPSAIVNATGAWVDRTLQQIGITTNGLMGGTKGSHFISHNERLRRCLNGKGIYAEAPDGRPIFILPFGNGTLVGTTDEPFAGDPADAVADASELEYLLQAVNEIAPQVGLAPSDVELHYSGVRPLPRVDASTPGAITRRHWMQEIPAGPVPLYCIIGGKLTTCRSLAEDSAATLLARLGKAVQETSRERPIPGSEGFPTDAIDQRFRIEQLGLHHGLTEEQVRAIWSLGGTRYERILEQSNNSSTENLAGTQLPLGVVRAVIRDEWVTTLNDLVERRLMLVFHPGLTAACLHQLADLMVAEGKLPAHAVEMEVERTRRRLSQHFGKQVQPA